MSKYAPISRQVIYRGHADGYSHFDVPTDADSPPPYPHARLLQAAPDLLDALERLLRTVEPNPATPWEEGSEVAQARAAIAKATQ